MAAKITVDEWLKELSKLDRLNPEGFTSREAAKALGLTLPRAQYRLKGWFEAGRIECVGRRSVMAMDGKQTYVPVYALVAKGRK